MLDESAARSLALRRRRFARSAAASLASRGLCGGFASLFFGSMQEGCGEASASSSAWAIDWGFTSRVAPAIAPAFAAVAQW